MSDTNSDLECVEISGEEPIIQLTENGIIEFEAVCRICASRSDNLVPIYGDEETNGLADKMNLYLPIKVTKSDILPLQCCFQCATTILSWHELFLTSVDADKRLRELHSEVEKEIVKHQLTTKNSVINIATDDECTRQNVVEELEENKKISLNITTKTMRNNRDDIYNDMISTPIRKSYECSECNKHFLQKSSLIRHVRVHKNERPFTCDVCGKSFVDKSALTRHIRHVHIRTKDFACNFCLKSFASAATRDDHQRSHTKDTPFICQTCGKRFGRKASLYIHSKIHSDLFPFACLVCSKKFRRRQELTNHITTHSDEKKFHCANCNKWFRTKKALVNHQLIHSNNKPFICSHCNSSYRQARYLKKHLKIIHSIIL